MQGTRLEGWLLDQQAPAVTGSLATRKLMTASLTWEAELNAISVLLQGRAGGEQRGGARAKCSAFEKQSVRLLVNYEGSCGRLHSYSSTPAVSVTAQHTAGPSGCL